MVTSPEFSGLFFKARAKRPYLSHTDRASNAEKQPTGPGPEGCVENGQAAALLVGYVSVQICALLAPCRRPILNKTRSPLFARRCTRHNILNARSIGQTQRRPFPRRFEAEDRERRQGGDLANFLHPLNARRTPKALDALPGVDFHKRLDQTGLPLLSSVGE